MKPDTALLKALRSPLPEKAWNQLSGTINPDAVVRRLDDVFTCAGWQDDYEQGAKGVVCKLRCEFGGAWIIHSGASMVGSGQQGLQVALDEALVSAAMKFGMWSRESPAAGGQLPAENGQATPAAQPEPEPVPPAQPFDGSANVAPMPPTMPEIIDVHRIIKGQTKNRTWKSAFNYCGVWPPDGWQEPTKSEDLGAMVEWLSAAKLEEMRVKLLAMRQ